MTMKLNDIIQKPMITEQVLQKVKDSVYGFHVHRMANKHQIKAALEQLFDIEIGSVRTILRKGKIHKVGKRLIKKQLPDHKIAYVKVKKGKIDLFPQT